MNGVIEIVNNEVKIHEMFEEVDAAEAAMRNIKRRVAVTGEVLLATICDEVVESDSAQFGYISFADAAVMLSVRYQQVFQRAVTKGKMRWIQTPVNHVMVEDVLAWKAMRDAR
jgi:hypothetical protein